MVNGQTIPNGATVPATATQTVQTKPAAYGGSIKVNYVRTWTPNRPYTVESDVTSGSRTVAEVQQATQYLDGLGRPLQTVTKQTSPLGKDMVSPVVYDAFGREQYHYLPYTGTTTNGSLHLDPFTEQETFLKSVYNPTNDANGEKFFYGKTTFEASPLNRPLKSFTPGNSWAGSEGASSGNEHATNMGYQINVANEVRLWHITPTIGATAATTGWYEAGQLYRTVTGDEHGKKMVEYKDKQGQVVLKKLQVADAVDIDGQDGWLCTYYVYDDFGLLRFVVPPKATEAAIANGWVLTTTMRDELCFWYAYDGKGRMIEKKVPGANKVDMVYDIRDRLVMAQDQNLRNTDQWLVTQYDELNRPIRTYLFTDDDVRSVHEGDALNVSEYPSSVMFTVYTNELLTETYYDNYAWVGGGVTGINGALNTAFTTSSDYITSFDTYPLYAQPVQQSLAVKGMVSGGKTKVLGSTGTYLYNISIYDDKGRPVQVTNTNISGGFDIATSQYDFAGKVLVQHHYHTNLALGQVLVTKTGYDHAGRVLKVEKNVNSDGFRTIAENTYNELGQLATKKLGNKPADPGIPLEILDYTYNIRGWLNGINKDYTDDASEGNTTRWFGMELKYDYGFSQGQYNGNIAGSIWKSRGSDKQRAYGFNYDNANRLLRGDFTQNDGGWNQSAGINYNMQMGDGVTGTDAYDANGNIRSMQQWGLKLTASAQLDDLAYTYNANSNKLKNVVDAVNDPNTKLGDFRSSSAYMSTLGGTKTTTATDYSYDANGNLAYDKNKDISSIAYNHLSLPQTITVTGKGSITYTYDAAGNKLKKVTVDNTTSPTKTTTTDYMAGFVYENTVLQFMPQEEGRIRELKDGTGTLTGYAFDYMVKDHLGNVRALLTDEQKKDIYLAGFETADQSNEDPLFLNYTNIVERPECFSSESQMVQVVGCAKGDEKAENWVVGAGKVIKVMAGDHVDAMVKGMFSKNANTVNPTTQVPIEDLMQQIFSSGIVHSGAEHGGFTTGSSSLLSGGIADFLSTQDNYVGSSAYLNWILLDEEQFKLVSSGSGFAQMTDPKKLEGSECNSTVLLQANDGDGIDIKRNGYLYVYVSNTSTDHPVYFDELRIEHTRGALLEETAYYPFGLTMAGISSKAVGGMDNKKKYNGKELQSEEFSDGSGLELYDYGTRFQDSQLGRWWVIDPLAEKYMMLSIYNYCANNPIKYIDLDGNEIANPNDPETIKLKATMMRTETGAKIWNQMEKSSTLITITLATHYDNIGKKMSSLNGGETMTATDYIKRSQNEKENFEDSWIFDPSTGEYKKSSEWNSTVIVLHEEALDQQARMYAGVFGVTYEEALDIAWGLTGSHEGTHVFQDYADFYDKKKGKDGKYIDQQKKGAKEKDYKERKHEKTALNVEDKARDEEKKKNDQKKKKNEKKKS